MRTLSDSPVFRRSFLSVTWFALAIGPALAGLNRWSGSGPGLATVARVMPAPSNAALIYAVTTGGSIVKSTDGGGSWRESNEGLPAFSISEFLIKPGAAETLFVAIGSDIFMSTDAADHWTKVGTIKGVAITTMAFEPASGVLYAGTRGGLFVSRDNGRTWTSAGYFNNVASIVVSPKGTVLVDSEGYGLYGSIDHGKTWSTLRGGSPQAVVAVDQNSTIYWFAFGQLSASSDEGKTWRVVPAPPATTTVDNHFLLLRRVNDGDGVLINPNVSIPAPGDLFALGPRTIFEYTDSSGMWKAVGPPISNGAALSMAITSSGRWKYWISTTDGGLLVSDGGDWTALNQGFGAAIANDVAVVAASPSTAYTATESGLFRTTNHGADWTEITPAGPKKTFSVAVDPSRTDSVYTSTDKLYKSTDSGSSWTGIYGSRATFLSVSPSNPATIYAVLSDRLAKSADSGVTWSDVLTGVTPYQFLYYGGGTSLGADPARDDTVYVGAVGGLYRVVADSKWKRVSDDVVRAVAVGPNESLVYVAPERPGLQKSADRGTTWATAGLIDKRIGALLLTGPDHTILYAGSTDGHVYRSTDSGNSWQGIDAGLDRSSIRRLASDRSGKVLYAATATGVREYEAVNIQLDALPDDPLRFPGLLNRALGDSLVVLPVAGTATSASGTLYTTDITLANSRDSRQDVILTWVPQGGGGVTSFHMTLPASSDATTGLVILPDFAQFLGVSGIGSLAIAGADPQGNTDPNASISASAQIWSHPSDLRAPFSQTVKAVSRQTAVGHTQSELTGLQHDAAFRSNVGIVNLSGAAHSYAVAVQGQRASSEFTVIVPPFSLLQMALPEKDYGVLAIDITADASTNWVAYGSTIDRITGEARTNTGN